MLEPGVEMLEPPALQALHMFENHQFWFIHRSASSRIIFFCLNSEFCIRAMPMSDNIGVCVLRSYACRETDAGQKHHYERRTAVSQAFLLEDVVGLV